MNIKGMYRIVIGLMVLVCTCSFSHGENYSIVDYKKNKKPPHHLKSADYMKWVESIQSGLCVRTSQKTLDFIVQYRPLEYIVLKECRNDKNSLTKKKLKERKKEMEDLEYYTFSIALNDGRKDLIKSLTTDFKEYDFMLRYFSNDLQKDIKLISGADTLDCKLFHFERTYGITAYAKFVLGFEKSTSIRNRKSDRTLLFFARIFGMEEIQLQVKEKMIQNIPKISFKE